MYLDEANFRELAGGETDVRIWASIGLVAPDVDGSRSVRFADDDTGEALPEGPLVTVKLQPTGITVVCRVFGQLGGNGTAAWHPLISGDEVLVVLPTGHPDSGGVIVGRGSNSKDVFPTKVAGQDVTKNTVGFLRMMEPYLVESATAVSLRNAATDASINLNPTGDVLINDGEHSILMLSAAGLALQLVDGVTGFSVDAQSKTTTIRSPKSALQMSDDNARLFTTGTFNIGTSGLPGSGHAITLEQVINLLVNWTCVLASPAGFVTSTGPLTPITAAQLPPIVAAVLKGATSPLPPGPAPGGVLDALGLPALIASALASQLPDPAATGAPSPVLPGIGRPGLLF